VSLGDVLGAARAAEAGAEAEVQRGDLTHEVRVLKRELAERQQQQQQQQQDQQQLQARLAAAEAAGDVAVAAAAAAEVAEVHAVEALGCQREVNRVLMAAKQKVEWQLMNLQAAEATASAKAAAADPRSPPRAQQVSRREREPYRPPAEAHGLVCLR
jgi:PIN domain nuclease of toxin-antitoxin system